MTSRSKRFQPVVDVAEKHEEQEARRFGDCQQILAEEEFKLEQLEQYRDEYARQFAAASESGMGAMQMRDYRAFLERLNQAIEQQLGAIQRAQEACEEQRGEWLHKRSRAQALDKVAQRYRADEKRHADRQEQALLDEHASRMHSRKPD